MLSGEWRCSWSSTDRRCSNYIWVINNLIAYLGASYIRDLTVVFFLSYIRRLKKFIILEVEKVKIFGLEVGKVKFFGQVEPYFIPSDDLLTIRTKAPSQNKDHLSSYGGPHVKDKNVTRQSYLWHEDPYTGKMASLYWETLQVGWFNIKMLSYQ